jgi:4-diphosphocytidyl-2-C-methyl-D-erythritol kinase
MADTLMIRTPAKVNLTLEVLGKRTDGFHEIRSVIQSVDFYDTLFFTPADGLIIRCDMPGWNAENSLVNRAADLIGEKADGAKGVRIDIIKRIPLMAGLGGDSTDAAAILRGLNEIRGLGLSPDKLSAIAAELGSDVPFFLQGGTALATGRGEGITALPSLPQMWMVLVVPDVPASVDKTARMYQSLTEAHYTDGKITERLVDVIRGKGRFSTALLFNTFENIAFQDSPIRTYKEHLDKLGAPDVHLAGSGPTLFTVFDDKTQADDLYNRCKDQGMRVYLVKTL